MIRPLLIVFSVVLLTLTSVTLWLSRGPDMDMRADGMARLEPAAGVKRAAIGGPFDLIDQNGKHVTNQDFKGKLMLVFFGYTHCPDICPVTLSTLTSIMNHLGDKKAGEIVPVFITLDPARDTPARLKEYLKDFHPAIVGLTGDQAHVTEAAKSYKIYSAKSGKETGTNEYMVDHSSLVYIMGRNGEYLGHFSQEDSEQSVLDTLNAQLH